MNGIIWINIQVGSISICIYLIDIGWPMIDLAIAHTVSLHQRFMERYNWLIGMLYWGASKEKNQICVFVGYLSTQSQVIELKLLKNVSIIFLGSTLTFLVLSHASHGTNWLTVAMDPDDEVGSYRLQPTDNDKEKSSGTDFQCIPRLQARHLLI